jgi:hypothetical protein
VGRLFNCQSLKAAALKFQPLNQEILTPGFSFVTFPAQLFFTLSKIVLLSATIELSGVELADTQ